MDATAGDTSTAEPIIVYSDYVCPFCYLGRESLSRYQADREQPLKIEWRPFDLRRDKRTADGEIDHSVDDGKDDAYFDQAKASVQRLQAQYDVDMALDLAIEVDSLPAQLASYHVFEQYPYETWLAFDAAIFEALWVDGRDIGEKAVLRELAADVDIDPDEISAVLDNDEHRTKLDEAFTAAQRAGITGVPTFGYDGHAARGAVPPEQLRRLVEGA